MRLIDVDYKAFDARLKEAATSGERIEAKDRERWKAYVAAHNVREAAALAIARQTCERVAPVVIDSPDEWNGYYLHSKKDEVCLKYTLER